MDSERFKQPIAASPHKRGRNRDKKAEKNPKRGNDMPLPFGPIPHLAHLAQPAYME
jgi:hypothetical protein